MRNSDANVKLRRQNIINYLKKMGRVSIKDISREFDISEITVRRDLDMIETLDLVERSRGTVCLSQKAFHDTPLFDEKSSKYTIEKDKIAREAATHIQEGDVVFVNSGTTVLYLPKYIRVPNVKIVTNNACMATAEGQQNIELFITGGERYPKTQSLVGDICISSLLRIKATKCILSVNGISAESGITSSYYMETSVNVTMLSQCTGERIVIADSSKLGKSYSFISADLSMIDNLITDDKADIEELNKISALGVKVIIAQ